MVEKNVQCPRCKKIITYSGSFGETIEVTCPKCGTKGIVVFDQLSGVTKEETRNNPVVETDNLTKKFGRLTAVNSLNLFIEEGEIYGLLGPNGSGKTTTIKMLCGLLRPTSGYAKVFDQIIPSKSVMQDIGYMPQETAVYLDNTVHENILLFGEIYGMKKHEVIEKEKSILKFVNLDDRRDELVSNLSGGMKHRLSLACALVHEPRILFLDEPTVGVDPELRETFWHYFNIISKEGKTILITTHYMDEASHCSKVGFLRQGKLIAKGKPDFLKEQTSTDSLEDAFLALAKEKN
jgi:ABC-2 type transport system ATP-binding protein